MDDAVAPAIRCCVLVRCGRATNHECRASPADRRNDPAYDATAVISRREHGASDMSVVAALLLLLGQSPSGSVNLTPGGGTVYPDSGGIPTTPPPPPPNSPY